MHLVAATLNGSKTLGSPPFLSHPGMTEGCSSFNTFIQNSWAYWLSYIQADPHSFHLLTVSYGPSSYWGNINTATKTAS